MKILVIDVGGTNVKILASGQIEPKKIPSGREMSASKMVQDVMLAAAEWPYEAVAIGYPGPVVRGKPMLEPKNLADGWVSMDFSAAFQKPTKIINDAAMQALGSYEGGRMLFLGLGTGLGSTLILDGAVAPLELAHLPYRKGKTFEDYVGQRGVDEFGKKKWEKYVHDVCDRLKAALVADYIVLGGGNAKHLKELPADSRLGDNKNAFIGGFRLWENEKDHKQV
ncbi:MAG: ROK family protein [Gemmataceae bacterium]